MKKYEQIVEDIISKISSNVYPQGEQLPTENELCIEYNCSKITIKKALEILTHQGLLFRQRGNGTFVNKNAKFWQSFMKRNILGHERGNNHLHLIETKVLKFEIVIAPRNISTLLGISDSEYTYHFIRVRLHDNKPSIVEESYVPISIIDGLSPLILEKSLFQYIEDNQTQKIDTIHKVMNVVEASEFISSTLEIPLSEPVVKFEEVNYLNSGIAFEHSIMYQNYRDFSFYSIIRNTL